VAPIIDHHDRILPREGHHVSSVRVFLRFLVDERLVPNLPRGRGRSIGGDLNVGEEGIEQTIVTLQSLHHGSVGY
jgi:hypothetical protein